MGVHAHVLVQVRNAAQDSIIELTKMQPTDQLSSIIIAMLALSDRRKSTDSRVTSVALYNLNGANVNSWLTAVTHSICSVCIYLFFNFFRACS